MAAMRPVALLLVAGLMCSACGFLPPGVPAGAYYPLPREPHTQTMAQTLFRAAEAAGDDPLCYSFALLESNEVIALSAPDTVFYFSEGLATQPTAHRDALVAQAVAHAVLRHDETRRAISFGISVGFTAVGFMVPGLGLADFVVNPLVVRAFSRQQELAADRKALEILRAMGHRAPRRMLADALDAAARATVQPKSWDHRGLLADQPPLADRLAALEPMEAPIGLARASMATTIRAGSPRR
jgi:Zn-dependent protease with chaperone function